MTMHQPQLTSQQAKARDIRAKLFSAPKRDVVVTSLVNRDEIRALKDIYDADIETLNKRIKQISMWAKAELDREREQHAAAVSKLELDLADARARLLTQAEMLKNIDDDDEPSDHRRPVPEIVAEVLKAYPGVTWEDVKGIRRTRELVAPRHACMKAVYDERKDLSLPRIGRLFGGRDHTTILHAVRKEARKP